MLQEQRVFILIMVSLFKHQHTNTETFAQIYQLLQLCSVALNVINLAEDRDKWQALVNMVMRN
jgi:hypothetical protein